MLTVPGLSCQHVLPFPPSRTPCHSPTALPCLAALALAEGRQHSITGVSEDCSSMWQGAGMGPAEHSPTPCMAGLSFWGTPSNPKLMPRAWSSCGYFHSRPQAETGYRASHGCKQACSEQTPPHGSSPSHTCWGDVVSPPSAPWQSPGAALAGCPAALVPA